jgi:hypothetical protein
MLSSHFETMASSGEPGSTAHTLVDEASRRSSDLSTYLEGHQFGEIVSDLKGFARRRPGAFILGSAVAGLVVGRLGRAVKDAPDSADTDTDTDTGTQTQVQPPAPPVVYPVETQSVTREFEPDEPTSVVPTAGTLDGGL